VLAALYFLCRNLYSEWSAAGRRLLLDKQEQESFGDSFANLPANMKQDIAISFKRKSSQFDKKF